MKYTDNGGHDIRTESDTGGIDQSIVSACTYALAAIQAAINGLPYNHEWIRIAEAKLINALENIERK